MRAPTALVAGPRTVRLALVGNPNVGKTSLFNALTGLQARVGNYAGVTVEKKLGRLQLGEARVELVDLPGVYALAPHAPDELVAFEVLLGEHPDLKLDGVLVVLDATNLERNLYLFSQLEQLGLPVVVALSMVDQAEAQGLALDLGALAQRLGVPVHPVHPGRRRGLQPLKEALGALAQGELGLPPTPWLDCGAQVDAEVGALAELLRGQPRKHLWPDLAVFRALVDEGGLMEARFCEEEAGGMARLEASRGRVQAQPSLAALEARVRYAWVRQVLQGVLRRPPQRPTTFTDRLDALLTHPWAGMLIFLGLMACMFQAIYAGAAPLMEAIDGATKALGGWAEARLPEGAWRSLVVDGAIAGVGAVLIFLPQIAILFLIVQLLEDCGYMARAAFMMDRVMRAAGLSGKAFIPMLSGFACAVPSIIATRTMEDRRDRLATILALPLMSCSARLPVYSIMIGAFVPALAWGPIGLQGLVLLGVYALGVLLAIPLVWTLKRSVLKGQAPALVMELPSYRWPSLRVVGLAVYGQAKDFLGRAGGVIFALSLVVWALAYFPHDATLARGPHAQVVALAAQPPSASRDEALAQAQAAEAQALVEHSYLAQLGRGVQPLFAPLGWDWRITTGVLASFPAREVIVSTLGTLYSLGAEAQEGPLAQAMQAAKSPDGRPIFSLPVAMSVVVFFALCLQCMSTLAVMWRETGHWKWPFWAFVGQTTLAYLGAWLTHAALSAWG